METNDSWLESLQSAASLTLDAAAERLPAIFIAVLILVVGWLLARLARNLVLRMSDGVNRLLDRVFRRGHLASTRVSPAVMSVAGGLAFWVVIFIALQIAVTMTGFESVGLWLSRLVTYLPDLVLGVLMVMAGYLVSVLARDRITIVARQAGVVRSESAGKAAQVGVLSVALIVGLDQVGIDVAILIVLAAIVGAAALFGVFTAFGLGARTFVSNLIGAHNARSVLSPGVQVRIGDHEGQLLEITGTHIALDTAQGRLLIPAAVADTEAILVLTADGDKEIVNG